MNEDELRSLILQAEADRDWSSATRLKLQLHGSIKARTDHNGHRHDTPPKVVADYTAELLARYECAVSAGNDSLVDAIADVLRRNGIDAAGQVRGVGQVPPDLLGPGFGGEVLAIEDAERRGDWEAARSLKLAYRTKNAQQPRGSQQ